jgi:pantetheine-phosphate adenylyltransferase
MNRKMEPTVETIFMMPKEEYTYISSRIVKEIARLGGNVQSFVPDCVVQALAKKSTS